MRIDQDRACADILHPRRRRGQAEVAAAMALIAREKHVPIRLLVHYSRCRAGTARARQMAMYLCHVVFGISLADIGEAFGRDRTTVSHACGLIEDLRDDPEIDAELERFERLLLAETDHE